MFVHGGAMLFGMVNRVPKVGYVATLFAHLNLVPLIPIRSYLILEPSRRGRHYGWPIPLSWKSVLMAWGRVGLLGGMGVSGLAALIYLDEVLNRGANASVLVLPATALVVSTVLWVTSLLANRAGFAQALKLGAQLGIEPLDMEQILATSRQSLTGLANWYLNSFDGAPKPPPSDWWQKGLPPSSPAQRQTS